MRSLPHRSQGPQALRPIPLFAGLDEAQLGWLCTHGAFREVGEGIVYEQGEPAASLYVLLSGEVAVTQTIGGEEIELLRTDSVGTYSGATQPFVSDSSAQVYLTSMRALETCQFFVLPARSFASLLRRWNPMALHLLQEMHAGFQRTKAVTAQRERLLALGSLTAGLTHELNNPAAAASAAAGALVNRVHRARAELATLAASEYTPSQLSALVALQDDAAAHASEPSTWSPIQAADLSDALVDWLAAHGVPDGWDLAPTLAQVGIGTAFVDEVLLRLGPAMLVHAVRSLNYTIEIELLLREIGEATGRISTLLAGVKQYTQLDRAPHQSVDIHDLLESTLMMFRARLAGADITVVRDYDLALPRIPAFAGELNQVWTNLIENALDAMGGRGTLTIRTHRRRREVDVTIMDSGPGIPDDVRPRIFEPFFTTKAFGKGTGLGLDVAARIVVNRHRGTLDAASRPGETRMIVTLPLDPPSTASPAGPEGDPSASATTGGHGERGAGQRRQDRADRAGPGPGGGRI